MIQSESAGQAKTYFDTALVKSDYYIGDQELNGTFRGQLTKRLGIEGIATRERFHALCENRHPETGKPLTPRTKQDRTIGYDINFHVPKSVSILHVLSPDNHILDAFHGCVNDTMKDIEALAMTRVRKGNQSFDKVTGELIYVDFIHQTARPVDGFTPDPHLHAHCYVFNVTWDEAEQRLKAGQFREMNREMPYFQALFQKRLADKLISMGYEVRRTAKAFEVIGVPEEVIALFSKRTDEIGRVAKEKGITDAKELAELGARTRSKKQKGMSMPELIADWRDQIQRLMPNGTPENKVRDLNALHKSLEIDQQQLKACIDHTIAHCFTRASVVPLNKLAAEALAYSIGANVTADSIVEALAKDDRLLRIKERNLLLCTTKEVLKEEERMVALARQGKGRFEPLYKDVPGIKADGQQQTAIRHILTTPDMVSIVRGAAGAGKTTLMKEAIPLIEAAGKQVTTVAPTSRASRGNLRDEGFGKAQTVALFLASEKMQEAIKDQVLWVDEAGMLGTKDMKALLEICTAQNARLILGGDTRQHASVLRGDALRILNTVGGIQAAEVDKIYRQKEQVYRSAVADLSKGNIADGFAKLDGLGAIKENSRKHGYSELISDYVTALKSGKKVMIISPTHDEGERVTELLRQRLQADGFIGKKQLAATRYKSLSLTDAQKADWRNYEAGQVVQFNQNRKGVQRGSAWLVQQASEGRITLTNPSGKEHELALEKTEQFDLYKAMEISIAKGDKLQITRNGFDKNKDRLNNGQIYNVQSVSKKGEIVLQNEAGTMEYRIDKSYSNFTHAHCVTSHASQGSTVDEIYIAQPSATFGATDAKQFYVSVSRAREKVAIYTDDKAELLYYASQHGDRQSAMEFLKGKTLHDDHILQVQRERELHPEKGKQFETEPAIDKNHYNYEEYEPGPGL